MDLPSEQKLSIPYFLLISLIECARKLRDGTPDQLAHHGLIKLLVEDALHTYTVPLSWKFFEICLRMMTSEFWPRSSLPPAARRRSTPKQKRKLKVKKPRENHQKKNRKSHEKKAKLLRPKQWVLK